MIKYWSKKIVELLFIAVIVVAVCGTYWGMWGKISRNHHDLMLKSLMPWQKQELANALNYYYDNNIAVKYTTGYLLRCDPSAASINRQFNWFYRNAISAVTSEIPPYHELVAEAYRSVEESPPDLSRISTMELELAIAAKCQKAPFMTGKDITDLALSTISLGIRIVAYSVNPILGVSLTVISLINAGRSDISKAIPGIICFMQIRCRNFIYSIILLWGFFTFLVFRFDRDKQKTGKAKSSVKKSSKARKSPRKRQKRAI
ncbi:MAG: hypothetical protein L3J71_07515 [Victivallaceae bacterium]|nr:hypothetical protein [Victivallaceae bacterium]